MSAGGVVAGDGGGLMGAILTGYGDAAYDHEGYPAQVLDDGSITATVSEQTRPRLVGRLVAACGCGWVGTTRYPSTGLFDTDAEGLALAEWEHSHARPVLHRALLDIAGQLGQLLVCLAGEHATRLTPESMAALVPAARVDVVDQVLAGLGRAGELARELRHSSDDSERPAPRSRGKYHGNRRRKQEKVLTKGDADEIQGT